MTNRRGRSEGLQSSPFSGLSTAVKMTAGKFLNEPGLTLSLIGTPISTYGQAKIYGLKMIQMILPARGHHLASFRALTGCIVNTIGRE
jgi:hypothetical protein